MGLSNEELGRDWDTANTLRENLYAADYKHIVLGLVFLKYISDAFSERRNELEIEFANPKSENFKKEEKARNLVLSWEFNNRLLPINWFTSISIILTLFFQNFHKINGIYPIIF
jgi:type I restriction-modification system DNA methylase subunit